MITLTNPVVVNSVLGGNVPISYDKLIIDDFTFSPNPAGGRSINGVVLLRSTVAPDMPELKGAFIIDVSASTFEITVPPLGFSRRLLLSPAQTAIVQGWITTAQTNIEQGFININVVAGTQSSGV